jgi:haloalkane dehalogenase
MRAFGWPERVILGEGDPYINAGVARHFPELFPNPELFLLPDAGHLPQLDELEKVAHLILSTPILAEGTVAGSLKVV